MKQQFLYEKTGTIRLSVYESNRPIIPSAATVTLYKPGGSELQAEASASVDATTGEMTYSITTTHTATNDLNYKAVWKYTVSGNNYYETQLFDVVKSILSIPITDSDIYTELESLRETNYQAQGTATAGAAGSLTDTANRKEDDNYWKGGKIETLAGTGLDQIRDITGFTQSTSVITISPNWTTTPDTTTTYRIIKSFSAKIQQCFEEIETLLYNKGRRHSLILEASQIKHPLLFLVISNICADLSNEDLDQWDKKHILYKDKFEKMFNTMKLDYDADESGNVQGVGEEQESAASLRIGRT